MNDYVNKKNNFICLPEIRINLMMFQEFNYNESVENDLI